MNIDQTTILELSTETGILMNTRKAGDIGAYQNYQTMCITSDNNYLYLTGVISTQTSIVCKVNIQNWVSDAYIIKFT